MTINNTNKYKSYLISCILDLIIILNIIYLVHNFLQFKFNAYLFAGDFRLNINRDFIGDSYLNLISSKYSYNNFIYLSFYPVFYFLQFLNYHQVLIYIVFGIPIFLYLSMKYILINIFSVSDLSRNLLFSSLAFFLATNPALFNRYIHWTILHGAIIYPIYLYVLSKYSLENKLISKYLFAVPVLLYLGAVTPQLVVVYTISAIIVFLGTSGLFQRKHVKQVIYKSIIIYTLSIVSFLHILYPLMLGYGKVKSNIEGSTTNEVLHYLSLKSNLVSAISGTNYYISEVIYFSQMSIAFILFIIFVAIISKEKVKKVTVALLSVLLLSLIVVGGYNSFPAIYKTINQSLLTHIIWLIKDPNMYYIYWLIIFIILFAREAINLQNTYLVIIALAVLAFHSCYVLSADKTYFNAYFKFIDVPKEYLEINRDLARDQNRNLWLPYNWYVQKKYTTGMSHFPIPSLWLTQNKELTDFTSEYKKLINLIDQEIYDKRCKNIYLLDWLIASQKLNILLDDNSVNSAFLGQPDIISKTQYGKICMNRLPHVYKLKQYDNISIYRSSLQFQHKLVLFNGSIDSLNEFLRENPVDIIYDGSSSMSKTKSLLMPYTVLNESYDSNWLSSNNDPPVYKVNFASMVYYGANQSFHYRGAGGFQKVVLVQKIVLVLCMILSGLLAAIGWKQKHNLASRKL